MTGIATAVVAGAVISGVASNKASKRVAEASEDSAAIQAESARLAIIAQREAAARAQGFLDPFAAVGQQGIDQAGFLANPQAQFDFLQNNPLFQASLDNANTVTQKAAASRGRLNAGDTLTDLSNNFLLSARPLIADQRQDIGNLLNLGTGIAGSQANIETGLGAGTSGLLTDIGNVQGAGLVGAANARAMGTTATANNINNALLSGVSLLNSRPAQLGPVAQANQAGAAGAFGTP